MFGRPPVPGAPWLPVRRPHGGSAPPTAAAKPGPTPPLSVGPPLRGAPWPLVGGPPRSSATPAGVAPRAAGLPRLATGPPLAGAPWAFTAAAGIPRTSPNRSAAVETLPPAHAGTNKPFIAREVPTDPRLRRFTEVVSQVMNSLMAQGVLYQTSGEDWAIDVAAALGLPGTGTGVTADGRVPGHYSV